MKIRTLLLTTFLTGAALSAVPAFAQQNNAMPAGTATSSTGDNQKAASNTSPDQNNQQMQQTASNIVGDINIAQIALMYGMNDDASTHINAARQAISGLNGQTPTYTSSTPMTAGKLSYKTAQGKADYWVPVVNDRFAVQEFDGKHLASKNPDIDVTDAQSIQYKMFLDTKVADEQLAKAQTAISQKQYDVAMNALQGVSKGAISEIVAEDRPMEAARDNLILARELLNDKDYRGSSFALKHANKELARVEKDNPGSANDKSIKDMRSQIDSLQASIAQENPSALTTAEQKIDGWIKDVKAKI